MKLFQRIIKRNGQEVDFDKTRIFVAIKKAFLSENESDDTKIKGITDYAIDKAVNTSKQAIPSVEFIQDVVETSLMEKGFHKVAKNYILYRAQQQLQRTQKLQEQIEQQNLYIKINDTDTVIFDPNKLEELYRQLTPDLMKVSISDMVESVKKQVYNLIPQGELDQLILDAARERIEKHYDYAYLSSRILLGFHYQNILSLNYNASTIESVYRTDFPNFVKQGLNEDMLHPDMGGFDLKKLGKAIQPQRDELFSYLGTQILTDRYLLRDRSTDRNIYELPQWFWMRVSMGLSLKEAPSKRDDRAIEFYNVLSQMDLVSSTPTLFNSGTTHSQMSSCYLNTSDDSLSGIFKLYSDNAKLSKWAGGIGTDWSYVRATGSRIRGTNGQSQGVIPFVKIFNDVALAVNQGGKRKGAMCAYLEVWHLDFEQFIELRKNTGDERRRAHDINTAAWIPDLFMKRVERDEDWTLFCPADTPELHDLHGKAFEIKYLEYEAKNLPHTKKLKAKDLWKKMLTMLYETGHPWITYKDTANVRNPQGHAGVIHSSNLCTEITLNTSADETAVCNLASVNLGHMIKDGKIDRKKLEKTINTGMRMLDNVIDNNFYPTVEAERANLRHRAVGLGLMGYQDALYQLNISFDSQQNIDFADQSMELISFYAIQASSDLAAERGSYESFKGSKWEKGIFPLDTLDVLESERGQKVNVSRTARLEWDKLKNKVKEQGMRNSNCMAIAPTATIANISGVYPCTEPAYKNIYMKENLSGNFIVINNYLIDDLEKLNLWTDTVINKIKLNNGSIQHVAEIPQNLKNKYKETFEVDMNFIIEAAAVRSKWIDQSASTNIFTATTNGKYLSDLYFRAWKMGVKTTYYLRTLGATQVTKTIDSTTTASETPEPVSQDVVEDDTLIKQCLINDPDCEACQ